MEPHSLNDWQFSQTDKANEAADAKKSSTLPRVCSGVPKNRPPAKPPRRKISYPSESSTNASRSSDSPVLSRKKKELTKSQSSIRDELTKSNGCAEAHKFEAPGHFFDGSDYGSLPGSDFWPKMYFPDRHGRGSISTARCSTPTSSPHYACRGIRQSPNTSVYFTPPCTPCRNNCCCNAHEATNAVPKRGCNCGGDADISPIAVPKARHRRHHSDPQIFLERRPSKKWHCKRSKSQRSGSFVGASLQECHSLLEAALTEPTVLMEELRMLRQICNKLWLQLQDAQSKIERLQNGQSINVHIEKPNFSELLSQVYYAQKERDQAVSARIDLAYKERRQAIQQLERLKQVLSRHNLKEVYSSDDDGEELNSDKGIDKVLENIEQTNSPAKLLQHRDTLLTSIARVRDQRHHRVLQELKAVLADRDDAVSKALMLQEEMEQLLKAQSIWDRSSTNWNIIAALHKGAEERDKVLSQVDRVQRHLESFHLHQRMNNSMGEKDKELYKSNPMTCRTQSFKERREESKNQVNSYSSLPLLNLAADDDENVSGELEHLQSKLQQEIKSRQATEEKCKKLERLVDVLRKKMSGTSFGMAV